MQRNKAAGAALSIFARLSATPALLLFVALLMPLPASAKKYNSLEKKRQPAKSQPARLKDVRMVRHIAASGDTQASVAARYGVARAAVRTKGKGRKSSYRRGQVVHVTLPRTRDTAVRQVIVRPAGHEAGFGALDTTVTPVAAFDDGLLSELTGGTPEKNMLDMAAFSLLGAPYVFGGTSPNGIDCSAFVQRAYKTESVHLPRTAREQFEVGLPVKISELKRGDLLFFQTYASFPSHVGIYLGGDKMIHASSSEHKVTVSSFATSYFKSRFLGARRVDGLDSVPESRLAELVVDELLEAPEIPVPPIN